MHKTDLLDSTFPTYTEWFEAGKKGTKNREDCEELYQYLDSAERMLTDKFLSEKPNDRFNIQTAQ